MLRHLYTLGRAPTSGERGSRPVAVVTVRIAVLVVAILTVLLTADGTGVPGATCEPGATHDCTSPGTVRWWVALDGQQPRPESGSPTVAMEGGDLVFYVECDVVRALDRRSGRIRWKDTGIGALGCGSDHRLAYGDGLLVETEQWSPSKGQGRAGPRSSTPPPASASPPTIARTTRWLWSGAR